MTDMTTTDELDVLATSMERYLVDPLSRDDPYSMFARMRELDPVHHSRTGAWVFTRYDDVNAVLRDPRWSRGEAAKEEFAPPPEGDDELSTAIEVLRRQMINLDDPDHARIRRLLFRAFTPTATAVWQPRVQDVAKRLVEAVRGREQFDLLADIGFPLPEIAICELLGVPVEDHALWKEWIAPLVAMNRMSAIEGAELEATRRSAIELTRYFGDLCEQRRRNPREDLVSTLVEIASEGERLHEQELIGAVIMLVTAGHETAANLIGNGMACLLWHPDQYALLRNDPSLVPGAVEEMLRFEGPPRHPLPRRATEDIVIRGVEVPAGAVGLPLLSAANRDPEMFDSPDTFDVCRQDNKHLGFGFGSHYCLGAALARMEAVHMFEAIVTELPRLELAQAPRWKPSFLRALDGLVVEPTA